MERYSVIPSKAKDFAECLLTLIKHNLKENDDLVIFDSDTQEWVPITGLTYSHENGQIRLYCDEL